MLVLDGRMGEGGGQVLRTALSLSAALGRPVRLEHVRGGRARPGLLRQHLTALAAIAELCGGEAVGAELRSAAVELHPGPVRAGEYRFAVGTAGSALLVLQTVLPPLLLADGPSVVALEGGTHNPWAPPFEFVARSFLPLLARTGARVAAELVRPGFYPAGGGELVVRIEPARDPRPLELLERGAPGTPHAVVHLAHLPRSIAERERKVLVERLDLPPEGVEIVEHPESRGPGNAVVVHLPFAQVEEVVTGFGEKRVPAERVAGRAADEARAYLEASAPVGEHLADQLMVPLALLAGGRYRTGAPSSHARTNAAVIDAFLPGAVGIEEHAPGDGLVSVYPRQARGDSVAG